MPTHSRFSLVSLLAFVLPTAALAGPIEWTYTSTFHAAGQPNMPSVYVGAGGSGAGGSYMISAALQGLTELGYPSNPGSGPYISVGHFEHSTVNAANQMPPTLEQNFELRVAITDTASGESGAAVWTGFFTSTFTDGWPPNELVLNLTSPSYQRLMLGATRYELDLNSTYAIYGGNGDVTAYVQMSPASTPEPGTLALAGIGLFGVFGLRRWRKG